MPQFVDALSAVHPMSVVVTVDTEPDDAWSDHLCKSVRNVRALRRLDALLREFGAKATLLITYRVVQDAECVDLLRGLVSESGAEVGAHLHPWETPPFMPGGLDVRYPAYPYELPPAVFAGKLERLTDAIAKRIGRPTAYRAGRWGLAAEHLPILEGLGYQVDSSVTPLLDWRLTPGIPWRDGGRGGVDYRCAPQRPYHPSYDDIRRLGSARIVEVPITVGFTRPVSGLAQRIYPAVPVFAQRILRKLRILQVVWATPAWESRADLERMIRMAIHEGTPVINIALHSSELTVSALPECNTPAKVDEVFRRIETMLELLAAQRGCEFTTLSAVGRRWAELRRAPALTRTATWHAARLPTTERAQGASVSIALAPRQRPRSRPTAGPMSHDRTAGDQVGVKNRLVYVLAASHSGSTLLSMLLAAHPDVCTVGELKTAIPGNLDAYPCSCGRAIRSCHFWARIRTGMARHELDFDIADAYMDFKAIRSRYVHGLLKPLHRARTLESLRDAALWCSPRWRTELPVIQRRNAALVDTICAFYGCHTLVDSSKYALRLKYLLRNPDLDVQIIRLIRDGRAVALTYYLDEKRLAMRAAAHEWRRSNEEAEELLAGADRARWIALHYEDLCADPLAALRGVFQFLGLDAARATLDFRARDHHIVGNSMRTESTTEIRLDDRWKTDLTAQDLREFDAVAGPLNRRYGYG